MSTFISRLRTSLILGVIALSLFACRQRADEPDISLEPVSLRTTEFEVGGDVEVVESARGMVTSGHPLASQVGAEVLARGGNAIDSAVATGLALAVVLPRAGNIGGGGFLVYRSAEGDVRSLDFREKAPSAASRDMYLDEDGEPTRESIVGHRASGVPGSVAGLWEMHRELGSLPWNELVEPAIELARGHTLDPTRAGEIERATSMLKAFPASAEKFLPDGSPLAAGAEFSQPDLAKTLERIRDSGHDGFYGGETARLIVAEMERGEGLITLGDLEAYEAKWREPVTLGYRGYTIYTMPPPSSGGVTLAILFNVLEAWDALPPFGSSALIQIEAETMRRAFIDRNRYLADPDFLDMPIERLVSDAYAQELRLGIIEGQATPTANFDLGLPAQSSESSETTHYSIVDEAGNATSITTTINGSFGSFVTVAGAGFLLNNEMDDFAAAPGRPNLYGLVEGEANTIAPHKRMLSSMTPSIVLDPAGDLTMVVGSPGGPTIITTVFQVISNVLDHGMSLGEAVAAPRLHHQALPDRIFYEKNGFEPEVVETLEGMGYEVEMRDGVSGNVSAIGRSPDGESWQGVADPRRNGGAAAPDGP